MTLKQLRYFLGVLQAGSLTAAARTLHVAQPAIGAQIRSLEDALGVKLLIRHSRGVAPTEAGERLARNAAGLITEIERMRREIMEMDREPSGKIALGLTRGTMHVLGAELVAACLDKYPGVFLRLAEGMSHQLTERLSQGELDVTVTCAPPENSGTVSAALATESLFLATPAWHPLAERPDVALQAVLDAELVVPPKPSRIHGLLTEAARERDVELRVACTVESVMIITDLVRHGVGCAVMPFGAIRREVEDGRLAALRIVDPPLARTLYLTCAQGRPAARAAQAVCREIQALAAAAAASGTAGWTPPAATVAPQPRPPRFDGGRPVS